MAGWGRGGGGGGMGVGVSLLWVLLGMFYARFKLVLISMLF